MRSAVVGLVCSCLALLGCSDDGGKGTGNGAAPGGAGGAGGENGFAVFQDQASVFETPEVHDADREVVMFDVGTSSMVTDGAAVAGWMTQGNDLSWERSGVAFRVRFGTEDGERRAYFTETGSGTICDLRITPPDGLNIYATSEFPPEE